jgi:hypothetical protein
MPQAALGHTEYDEGGALVLPHDEHKQTRTYGPKGKDTKLEDADTPFRDVLAKDFKDVRRIAGSKYNKGLKQVADYYRKNFPDLIRKGGPQ